MSKRYRLPPAMMAEALRRHQQAVEDRGDEAIDVAEEIWRPDHPLTRDPVEASPVAIEAGRWIFGATGDAVLLGQCSGAEHAAEIRAILAHAVIEVHRCDRDALRRANLFSQYWHLVTAPRPHPWPSVWDDRVGDWVAIPALVRIPHQEQQYFPPDE